MAAPKYKDLILDIGGVLIFYSPSGNTALPPRTIKTMLNSLPWHQFERGTISQQECFDRVTAKFCLAPGQCAAAISQMRSTMKLNVAFIKAVKDMKRKYPWLRVHAFSNISTPDLDQVRPIIEEWDLFNTVFGSGTLGCRKPEFDSFKRVLEMGKIDAGSAIFLDDRVENVTTARTFGIQGIVFDDSQAVISRLHNLLGDPVSRGMEFLNQRSNTLFSETDQGVEIKDNFSQLLILQCINDRSLITLENEGNTWQYFIGQPFFTDDVFPKDADTTALALATLDVTYEQKNMVMDEIFSYVNPDGLPMVYLDSLRPRVCPYVCANVLRLFFLNGQGDRLAATVQYLCRVLETKAYEAGSRYYCQPDWIFYYLADLCGKCSDSALDELRAMVVMHVKQRMGIDKDVTGAAMRVISAQSLHLNNTEDLKTLLDTQQLDGGWELNWMVKYGSVSIQLGNRGVTTAMAIKAIKVAREAEQRRTQL